jgi:hypothetical protein
MSFGITKFSKSTKNFSSDVPPVYSMAVMETGTVFQKVMLMLSWKPENCQMGQDFLNFGKFVCRCMFNSANVFSNPWGKGKRGNWEGAWSDGSKEFTPEAQRELNHKFGSDSVFWISYQDLLRKYQHFDRTRLFMDSPDWRLTQKWISVEVPWKAEFEQKFRIVLKMESPVVLVLGQLDDRYFDGLQGQYSFRLQFRLHEVDSPGEEDYIVRSHGNYLMERSVVTELKSLKAGTYSVFIMVVADRDTSAPSVEDVVKAQCRRKIDNDKLAQVGVSYDLAHSKGAAHTESRAAARKAQDKAKARESRIATRRKNWEKRHLSREIVRKQEKKNREKRERKEVKDVAEAKEKEVKEPKDKGVQTEEGKEVKFEKEGKAMQTEEPSVSSTESDKTVAPPKAEEPPSNETDKAVQTDDMSATDSSGTPETPKSSSILNSPPRRVIHIPMHHTGPPPPPPPPLYGRRNSNARNYARGPPQRSQYITSDGESSASPISDFDDMYSDDDPTLKPRPINTGGTGSSGTKSTAKGSDDEDEIEPWNAVCIIGFRVYSKDEGLEVKVYEEGIDDDEDIVIVDKDEEGTDGDVEEVSNNMEKEKTCINDKKDAEKDIKMADADETKLPIRSKEAEALVLFDNEKKAMGLGNESIVTENDKIPMSLSRAEAVVESDTMNVDSEKTGADSETNAVAPAGDDTSLSQKMVETEGKVLVMEVKMEQALLSF